ncbi:MAG TPA: hypothetical protein VJ818_01960 [Actinomycetota bacterium]|nr:hypothetical protein [Actinomycetota bacterium]
MEHPRHNPRPTKPHKRGPTEDDGHPQPTAPEVESARLLANDAKGFLKRDGLSDNEIRRLADEFIALDLGEGVREFVDWARTRERA